MYSAAKCFSTEVSYYANRVWNERHNMQSVANFRRKLYISDLQI